MFDIFWVSNLCCAALKEMQTERSIPRIIVTDIHSGQPVKHAKVKPYRRPAVYTNSRGEAKMNSKVYPLYELALGADKYHKTSIPNYSDYSYNEKELIALPNATIFRPGDTLHVAFVGNQRNKFRNGLLKNLPLNVYFRGTQQDKNIDTTLVLNEDGYAILDVPFTDDMRRGVYAVEARTKDFSVFVHTSVWLEDYRLPTFSLAFDDSCRSMTRQQLTPVTGRAIRTNGTPLAGAQVVASVDFGRYYHNSPRPLDTVTTDTNGSFRIFVSEEMVATYAVFDQMLVRASVTSADGETQEAQILVAIKGEVLSRPKHVLVAGVPKDSMLWLPKDSISVQGNIATLRLGVPRISWVYCVASSRSKILSREWKLLTPGMHAYTFKLPDKMNEYLDVRFLTCLEDGTFIERQSRLEGVNQTELHIVPVSMRDYLTPDAYETWTFRLTNAQGQPLQGRMVLAMTDKALESVGSSLWRNLLMPKWDYPYTFFQKANYNVFVHRHKIKSHILPKRQDNYQVLPVLFEPYRTDSARLTVIMGKVVDIKGEPVPGAVIEVQGTKYGTISDVDGYFSLAVAPNAILRCVSIGTKEVFCPAYNGIHIVLEENDVALNEVATLGYASYGSRSHGVTIRGASSQKVATLGVQEEEELEVFCVVEDVGNTMQPTVALPVLRQGDTRLALYLPNLQTDANGEIRVHFLTPPDNTEWIMQAMAWTQNSMSDYMTRTLMARRTLMLRLQMPRFMRHGDALSLPCIISNTADTTRHTHVTLQIRDAITDSLMATFARDISVAPNSSETLFFPYTASSANDVVVRAEVQESNGTSDGEQRRLSVLPVVESVSESLPFYMHASDSAIILSLPAYKNAANRHVTLMCCNNPLAYILAQLPQSVDSSAVTVTEIAHSLYALSLRNKLAQDYPFITSVNITRLETNLRTCQRYNGGFSWLKSNKSKSSWYFTLRVLALLGELQEANALDDRLSYVTERAVGYIDRETIRRESDYRKAHHDSLPDYSHYAQYAFVRAMFKESFREDAQRIYSAALEAMYTGLKESELTSWPLLALTFERAGQHDRALAIINGLRRYATIDHDHGMYWNNLPDRWLWYRQADLQASFLLAFSRIDPHPAEIDALRQWLIVNNRTTDWGQSSLNAYVTYVLMQGMPPVDSTQDDSAIQYITLPDTTTSYTLRHNPGTPAWGALMTSCEMPVSQLQAFADKALKIERRFERCDSSLATNSILAKGERIRVILTVTTDREMDNVVLIDRRAALLEPVGTSSYGWKDNALYYRDIRNAEERFYVEHLSRGTTVLSYDCYVSASGATLASLASIVSELAPEYVSYTTADSLKTE